MFLVKRVRSGGKGHAELVLPYGPTDARLSMRNQEGEADDGEVRKEAIEEGVRRLVQEQLQRMWDALTANSKAVGLRVEQRAAARLVGQTLVALCEIDKGTSIFSLF